MLCERQGLIVAVRVLLQIGRRPCPSLSTAIAAVVAHLPLPPSPNHPLQLSRPPSNVLPHLRRPGRPLAITIAVEFLFEVFASGAILVWVCSFKTSTEAQTLGARSPMLKLQLLLLGE